MTAVLMVSACGDGGVTKPPCFRDSGSAELQEPSIDGEDLSRLISRSYSKPLQRTASRHQDDT